VRVHLLRHWAVEETVISVPQLVTFIILKLDDKQLLVHSEVTQTEQGTVGLTTTEGVGTGVGVSQTLRQVSSEALMAENEQVEPAAPFKEAVEEHLANLS